MFGTVQIDENKVNQFSFAQRFKSNVHTRNVSNLIGSQNRLRSSGRSLIGIKGERGKAMSISSQVQLNWLNYNY